MSNLNQLLDEDNSPQPENSSHSNSVKSFEETPEKMKNGCCKDCMKAFNVSGRSCLCQVPKMQRRLIMPGAGCKLCSCHGCNPIDLRRDQRHQYKENFRNDPRITNKRQRILDSDDEDMSIGTEFDRWNDGKMKFM